MNTFNNLAIDKANVMMGNVAHLGIVWPSINKRDRKRLKPILTGIRSALQSAEHKLANSSHWAKAPDGWRSIDRLGALTNVIAKLGKLNAGVLDGGLPLKSALMEIAWIAYAKLEILGQDNAHYQQTNLPSDERGREDIYLGGFIPKALRKIPNIPDSALPPEKQWKALELADAFSRPFDIAERACLTVGEWDHGERSKCRESAKPISREMPEWFGGSHRRPVCFGQGSGLPFEPIAEPMPIEQTEHVRQWSGDGWSDHPKAKRVDNSAEAIANNRAWLAALDS